MIVGITGKKRSGKDTAANIFVEKFGYTRLSFAGPIKEACKLFFLWTDDYIEEHKEEIDHRWGISPRQALQSLGDDWAQRFLPSHFPLFDEVTGRKLWVNNLFTKINLADKQKDYVISDVRYQFEVDAIKNHNGMILHIERPGNTQFDPHASENSLDYLNIVMTKIINDGTKTEFENKVIHAAGNIFISRWC